MAHFEKLNRRTFLRAAPAAGAMMAGAAGAAPAPRKMYTECLTHRFSPRI